MTRTQQTQPEGDLPAGLAAPARRALDLLRRALGARGLSFANGERRSS